MLPHIRLQFVPGLWATAEVLITPFSRITPPPPSSALASCASLTIDATDWWCPLVHHDYNQWERTALTLSTMNTGVHDPGQPWISPCIRFQFVPGPRATAKVPTTSSSCIPPPPLSSALVSCVSHLWHRGLVVATRPPCLYQQRDVVFIHDVDNEHRHARPWILPVSHPPASPPSPPLWAVAFCLHCRAHSAFSCSCLLRTGSCAYWLFCHVPSHWLTLVLWCRCLHPVEHRSYRHI